MEKQMVLVLLLGLIAVTPMVTINSVRAQNLFCRAETYARVDNDVFAFMGPIAGHAEARSGDSDGGFAAAEAVVDVWSNPVTGRCQGPFAPGQPTEGGPWVRIDKSGNASALVWYEAAGAFTIDTIWGIFVFASGTKPKEGHLGIIVEDGTGIIYDVEVAWGYKLGVGFYFNEIERVGDWPFQWQVEIGISQMLGCHPLYQWIFMPTGLGRATLYVNGWIGSSPEDSLKADFKQQPVGGIVLPVDKLALLAPYIGLASTILVTTAATAIYVKRVKRRKKKQ